MAAIADLVRQQRGVVRRDCLSAYGISERALRAQLRDGVWRDAGAGVLVHRTAPDGLLTQTLILHHRMPGAIFTGPSAALLRPHQAWADQSFSGQTPLIIAQRAGRGNWRTVRHPGAVWDDVGGFQVADHHTTLVDLLRCLPWREAAHIAGAANRTRLTTAAALHESVARLHRAAGVLQLQRIVSALANGAESGPEIDLHMALRQAQIKGWQGNRTITLRGRQIRPDIVFLPERVALEYDGLAEHTGISVFHRERKRQNILVFAEWAVVRVTKEMLYHDAEREELLRDIVELVRQRRAVAKCRDR